MCVLRVMIIATMERVKACLNRPRLASCVIISFFPAGNNTAKNKRQQPIYKTAYLSQLEPTMKTYNCIPPFNSFYPRRGSAIPNEQTKCK